MAPSTMDSAQSSLSQTPLMTFTLFPELPIEIRLMIWRLSLPGLRIVHIRQNRLKEPEGEWWKRVRSDIAMWPCDKPFEQDELAPWEKDDWDAKFEFDYDGDDVFDDLAEVERLEKESEEQEAARKERLRVPDEWKGLHFETMPEHSKELDRRVKQGERLVDVLLEMIRDHRYIVVPKDYRREEGYTFSDSEGDQDEYSNADSQQESEFGDGGYRPKRLWGFSTESPTPALLLACRESRAVALASYRPIFSSLGAYPQIYFDSIRDSLFIDHESFLGEYEDLPSLAAKYLLPSDLAEVRELAIEGLGPYINIGKQGGELHNPNYELSVSSFSRY
ncbi:hypothetical protein BDZ45DRAFT_676367 [Acephala macrosclerotiorum]|nr:hypothetical protein BDZ45DRAFT_676367 [Acephala macrosclerotiorum]